MQRKLVIAAFVVTVWLIGGFCAKAILTTDNEPAHAPSSWEQKND